MPSIQTVRRTIRKARRRINQEPLPRNREELEIPEQYQRLENGELFLLYDSGVGVANRIIIFGTQRNLDMLDMYDQYFMDGTFKIVPDLFYQLYTVHVMTAAGYMIPALFSLLLNKTRETYSRVFAQMKVLRPNVFPNRIMVDFEQAAISAAEEAFPQAVISGCFYHLSQSVYRKVQSEGLQNLYGEDADFATSVRMIPALALVPEAEVVNAFELL